MAMGISQAYASELSNGKRAPKLELAGRICERVGIPVNAWVDTGPDDEQRPERLRQRVGAAMWERLVDEAMEMRASNAKKDRARGAA